MSKSNAATKLAGADADGFIPAAPKPAKPVSTMRVLDTTATEGPRTHDMPIGKSVQKFTFKPGEGLALPPEAAIKFLQHNEFKLVNDDGEILPYLRAPKQPEQLQAGEKLVIAEHETVARFDELGTRSLLQRCVERPGGEQFAKTDKPDRAGMIAFLIAEGKAKRVKNKGSGDIGPDEFVPEAELGDEPYDQYAERQDHDDD